MGGVGGVRGIDLDLLARHATWPRWWLGQALAAFLLVLVHHPVTARYFALGSWLPSMLVAAWPLAYGAVVVSGERLFTDARLRWVRTGILLYAPALLASFGACSSLELSPAYGLLLLSPPCWGHLFARNATVTASLAVSPLVLRMLTVPEATVSSHLAALAIGLGTAGLFQLFSWRRAARRRREARQRLAELDDASGLDHAASRWVARRLHDRVSGALMLAEARGQEASAELAARVVEETRAALDHTSWRPMTGAACAASIRDAARALGLAVQVDVRAQTGASFAWTVLLELLVELLGNQTRHGEAGGSVEIHVAQRAGAVRARVRGRPGFGAAAVGRGRRNLRLRVAALDGTCRARVRRHAWTVSIALPVFERARPRQLALFVIELAAYAVPLAILAHAGPLLALSFAPVCLVLIWVNAADMVRDRRLQEHRLAELRLSIARAVPAAAGRADAILRPALLALERAKDSSTERARAIAALAVALTVALERLEHPLESASEETAPDRGDERLRTARHAELRVEPAHVGAHGVDGDTEVDGCLLVARTRSEAGEDLLLAAGERLESGAFLAKRRDDAASDGG